MNPLQLLLFMIAGGLFNLIPKNSVYTFIPARLFFYLSCFIILSYIALYFLGIHERHVLSILTSISKYAYLIWIVLLGYLAVNISRNDFRSLYTAEHPDKKVIFRNTLYGLSVMIGCIFIIATIGKSQNFKQMSDFFKLCFNALELAGHTKGLPTQHFDAIGHELAYGVIEKNGGRAERGCRGELHG